MLAPYPGQGALRSQVVRFAVRGQLVQVPLQARVDWRTWKDMTLVSSEEQDGGEAGDGAVTAVTGGCQWSVVSSQFVSF